MQQGLVDARVEGVALLAELHQAELLGDPFQRFGDRLERALELTRLPGPADVVQDPEQLGQHRADDELPRIASRSRSTRRL